MKKVLKGQLGYYKRKKTILGIACLIGFILIFGIYLTGYMVAGTNKNNLTILAIILFIPTAKFLVDYFLLPWKAFATQEELDYISSKADPLQVYAELLMTAGEKRYQISYLVVGKDENIIAFTRNQKADREVFKKSVTNFLNYYNYDSKVELFTDYDAFIAKCQELAVENANLTEEEDEHIMTVVEKVSIMSV